MGGSNRSIGFKGIPSKMNEASDDSEEDDEEEESRVGGGLELMSPMGQTQMLVGGISRAMASRIEIDAETMLRATIKETLTQIKHDTKSMKEIKEGLTRVRFEKEMNSAISGFDGAARSRHYIRESNRKKQEKLDEFFEFLAKSRLQSSKVNHI
jgi:hypothetical protein